MKVVYPNKFSPSRNKVILDYCKWKKVLHIWACDSPYTKEKYNWAMWPLLYREIDKICNNQLWIDLDKKSIEFLNSKKHFVNSKIQFIDMNKLEKLDYKPDIIIFWEVIEHLMNIEVALTNIKKVMGENTLLIISTPNAFYLWNFLYAIIWREYMHEDHKIFFSYWYLKNLLKFNKLETIDFYFTVLDYDYKSLNIRWKIFGLFFIKIIKIFFKWLSQDLLFICKKKNVK